MRGHDWHKEPGETSFYIKWNDLENTRIILI